MLSEELLDPNCSGECQMKKIWCVQGENDFFWFQTICWESCQVLVFFLQEKCSGDPSKVETWVVTTTIEAGVGSCPAVVQQLCQVGEIKL